MPSVETIAQIVYAVMWTAGMVALITGVWALLRYRGEHRGDGRSTARDHQPAHARPATPSRLAVLAGEVLAAVRDLAAAHALLKGTPL